MYMLVGEGRPLDSPPAIKEGVSSKFLLVLEMLLVGRGLDLNEAKVRARVRVRVRVRLGLRVRIRVRVRVS